MNDILKRWIKAPQWMWVITVLLYGHVTLFISLNHTCCPAGEYACNHHLKCIVHHLSKDCTELHSACAYNQNSFNNKSKSHNQYCSACVYSFTSKSIKSSSPVPSISIETTAKPHVLSQVNFTKQFVLLSSIALRAPPIITS